MTEDVRKKHADFIRNPNRWMHWPFQPIKRYPKEGPVNLDTIEHTILYEGDMNQKPPRPIAYFANVWRPPVSLEAMQALKQIKYESVDALLDDGWVVD